MNEESLMPGEKGNLAANQLGGEQKLKDLEDFMERTRDAREYQRGLSVKLVISGQKPEKVSEWLNVSEAYISKWKGRYEREGVNGLRLGYEGKAGYLLVEEQREVVQWIERQEQVSVEVLRDHIEQNYGVVYHSKQSYYDLLSAGGMSYHKSEKRNPKYDEVKVLHKREEIQTLVNERKEEIEGGEVVLLAEDECHLLWGDVCGMVWGRRNQPIEVDLTNERQRQTYYGAVNFLSRLFHLKPFPAGNGIHTVEYVEWLRTLYPNAKLILLWDGASYHRYSEMQAYLNTLNAGLDPQDWPVTCVLFAPNAPEQNPVEDIWLKGKNFLRKNFFQNKTFAQVKQAFFHCLNDLKFDLAKFDWYAPNLHLI